MLAAEGAIAFLERVSPALEHVDSSSGSIGTAVGNAIGELVPIIANAPADAKTRDAWLERLFEAHQEDQIPYIERLADHWGELCASKEVASAWADKLVGITRTALSPDKTLRGRFHGTSACLSALYRAERFDELIDQKALASGTSRPLTLTCGSVKCSARTAIVSHDSASSLVVQVGNARSTTWHSW